MIEGLLKCGASGSCSDDSFSPFSFRASQHRSSGARPFLFGAEDAMMNRTRAFRTWLGALLFGRRAPRLVDQTEPKDACAFCSKKRDEVRQLFAGPTIYVCNECVDLGKKLIAEELHGEESDASAR